MAPDYDAADVAPVSEQIISNYAEIVEDAPWKDICCVLRPSGMHALGPKKFVRFSTVASTDIKTYDVGTLFLATVDGTAVNWGKLWVEYDIEFFEPQLNPLGNAGLNSSALGATSTTTSILATGSSIQGPLISGVALNVVSLQNMIVGQEYLMSWGAATGAQTITPSANVGMTGKTQFFSAANNSSETFTATATTGSLTLTASGNLVNPYIFFGQVPITTL